MRSIKNDAEFFGHVSKVGVNQLVELDLGVANFSTINCVSNDKVDECLVFLLILVNLFHMRFNHVSVSSFLLLDDFMLFFRIIA